VTEKIRHNAEDGGNFHDETGLLQNFAAHRGQKVFVVLNEAAGKAPRTGTKTGLGPSAEENPVPVGDERDHPRRRIAVMSPVATRTGVKKRGAVRSRERSGADRAVPVGAFLCRVFMPVG